APQRPEDHPAFARVLDELSPDEARILRLLASSGPQPALEVRRRDRLGRPAETLAAGLTLVARQAGCADPARGPEYLGNLQRLGLVDPAGPRLPDVRRYALLEAQPSTLQARAGARTRTVHRSVRLTAFGEQFVQVCFTLDGADAAHWSRDRHDPPAP
ncbi:MAG: Abi-alpha family protein, partial [Jatrophihabitans sp.]|uniref:Abi-alpha family protein n=1 Tax=Jatrophihabitans sp. TaxID=1932789 RepID=UPI003F7F3449